VLGGVLSVKSEKVHGELVAARTIQGGLLGSMESFLLLRSLRTLSLRMQRHSTSAVKIAKWLDSQSMVRKVWHPSLSHHPSFELCVRQLKMPPATFAFELQSQEQAQKLPQMTLLFTDATSLGGAESLLDWRYKWDKSLSPMLLRISVGLEDPDDLINDLKQAFDKLS